MAFWRWSRPAGTRATVDFASGSPVSIDSRRARDGVGRSALTSRFATKAACPEYIEFRSVDDSMRERFGVTPRVPFADGLGRLNAFLRQHSH